MRLAITPRWAPSGMVEGIPAGVVKKGRTFKQSHFRRNYVDNQVYGVHIVTLINRTSIADRMGMYTSKSLRYLSSVLLILRSRRTIGCAVLLSALFDVSHASTLDDQMKRWQSLYGEYDEDYDAQCVLDNVKPRMEKQAVLAIEKSCRHKATPKMCRDPLASTDCVKSCKQAGLWSRKIGECSLG